MQKTVTLSIGGQPVEFKVDYLSPIALEYWQAYLLRQAQLLFNPVGEFAGKLSGLPPQLQVAAVRAYSARVDINDVPKLLLIEAALTPQSIQVLLKLFTGQDIVPDDPQAAFVTLYPFIQKQERMATWDEVKLRREPQPVNGETHG